MRSIFQKIRSKKGVTLVELLIAMAIFTVVMTAVSTVFLLSMQNMSTTKKIDDALDEAKLELVLAEYRNGNLDENGEYSYTISDEEGKPAIYKVKVTETNVKHEFKSEGNSTIQLEQIEVKYRITTPNGAVVFKTYNYFDKPAEENNQTEKK